MNIKDYKKKIKNKYVVTRVSEDLWVELKRRKLDVSSLIRDFLEGILKKSSK